MQTKYLNCLLCGPYNKIANQWDREAITIPKHVARESGLMSKYLPNFILSKQNV